MSAPAPVGRAGAPSRPLPYWLFAVLVVVYLVIIQAGGLIGRDVADLEDDSLTTTEGVFATIVVPLSVALVFVDGAAAALGRLRPVLRDDRPVQRWVVVVPIVFAVAIVVATDYGALSEQSAGFVPVLLLATQLVGWGEEGMFRGSA